MKEYINKIWADWHANLSWDAKILAEVQTREREDSVHYMKIDRNKDFKEELLRFIGSQVVNFEIRGLIELEIEGIEGRFKHRMNGPHFGDFFKTYAPWITGAAGVIIVNTVGAPLWKELHTALQSMFHSLDPDVVSSIFDLLALGSAGVLALAGQQNDAPVQRQDREEAHSAPDGSEQEGGRHPAEHREALREYTTTSLPPSTATACPRSALPAPRRTPKR